MLEFEKVDSMSPAEERAFMRDLTKALKDDDGSAAEQSLAEGHPVYYGEPAVKDGTVCEYPCGRREVVRMELDGSITVLRQL